MYVSRFWVVALVAVILLLFLEYSERLRFFRMQLGFMGPLPLPLPERVNMLLRPGRQPPSDLYYIPRRNSLRLILSISRAPAGQLSLLCRVSLNRAVWCPKPCRTYSCAYNIRMTGYLRGAFRKHGCNFFYNIFFFCAPMSLVA